MIQSLIFKSSDVDDRSIEIVNEVFLFWVTHIKDSHTLNNYVII